MSLSSQIEARLKEMLDIDDLEEISSTGGGEAYNTPHAFIDDEDDNGDPRYGRMMNWYRTTDDAGFSGDLLTENSTNYRIFRTHKCGKANRLDAGNDYNACYAFPEDNVPF